MVLPVIGGGHQRNVGFLACPTRRFTIQGSGFMPYYLEQRIYMSFGAKKYPMLVCCCAQIEKEHPTLGHSSHHAGEVAR